MPAYKTGHFLRDDCAYVRPGQAVAKTAESERRLGTNTEGTNKIKVGRINFAEAGSRGRIPQRWYSYLFSVGQDDSAHRGWKSETQNPKSTGLAAATCDEKASRRLLQNFAVGRPVSSAGEHPHVCVLSARSLPKVPRERTASGVFALSLKTPFRSPPLGSELVLCRCAISHSSNRSFTQPSLSPFRLSLSVRSRLSGGERRWRGWMLYSSITV